MDREVVLFFVFSQFRSGSTMFCNSLSLHPDIVCPHESLNYIRLGRYTIEELIVEIAKENPTKRYIGLHGQYEQIPEELYSHPARKIMLGRRDQWKAAADEINLHYRRTHGNFDINPDLLKSTHDKRVSNFREMQGKVRRAITLYIEEICPLRELKFTEVASQKIHRQLEIDNYVPFMSYDMGRELLPRNFEEAKDAGKNRS